MAVTLTETAARRVQSFLTENSVGLRFGVRPSGCSGFAYVVDLADAISGNDHVYETHGVKVVVDDKSLSFLDGTCIDFRREGLNETFVYDNPNVKNECGCGESIGF
ncbi:MAG: iron-sulfur cluster assembly accessory protein [Gammaproteobacteria bacterium]|nr:iron-sulfur cluster assembly accessory protein [Gammaproteobacteria bacterium]